VSCGPVEFQDPGDRADLADPADPLLTWRTLLTWLNVSPQEPRPGEKANIAFFTIPGTAPAPDRWTLRAAASQGLRRMFKTAPGITLPVVAFRRP
jgi:hypothetical protein